MTAAADPDEPADRRKSRLPLLLGVVLALCGAAGGYFAVSNGLVAGILPGEAAEPVNAAAEADALAPIAVAAYVPLDPFVVSLSGDSQPRLLRFNAQIEVVPQYEAEVASLRPRIVDVLNGYLRAVDVAELSDPTALSRLRGQMLRRVQVVTGPERARDLLIMEFVLN